MQDRQTLDNVCQLTNVPRPPVAHEQLERARAPGRREPSTPRSIECGEMPDELRDVIGPLTERRDVHRDDVEAKEEILAEAAVGDRALEIVIGRGEDAHVHRNGLASTDALDLLRLDRAQQLRLRLRAKVTNLIEEQRSLMGELEAPDAPVGRSREGPSFMSEHLAFDEVAGNGRGVHAHERLVLASAAPVNRGCHQLLARSRLTDDEYARIGRRHALNQLANLTHAGAVTHHAAGNAQILAQRPRLTTHAPELERGAQREQHTLGSEWLLEEVERAELGGAHGVAQSSASAHHDDRHVWHLLAKPRERSHSIDLAGHHEIEEDRVRLIVDGAGRPARAVRGLADRKPLGRQQRSDHAPDVRLVVDDQDRRHVAPIISWAPYRRGQDRSVSARTAAWS